jgi:DNA-directed RNA polymerase subunit RPC12/RpoP
MLELSRNRERFFVSAPLWRKAVLLGGGVFVGAEILLRLLLMVAHGSPFFWLGIVLLQPFSTLLDLVELPVYPAWPINLVGWVAVGYYVVRRRSRGEPLNPLSPEITQKIVGRGQMFLAFLALSLICLLIGALLIAASVWLSPPAVFDGAEGWEAFGLALTGEVHVGPWGAAARIAAILLAIFAAFSMWYAIWMVFMGRDIMMDYLCPHCRHSFEYEPLPEPPAVIQCPGCGEYIRRDDY